MKTRWFGSDVRQKCDAILELVNFSAMTNVNERRERLEKARQEMEKIHENLDQFLKNMLADVEDGGAFRDALNDPIVPQFIDLQRQAREHLREIEVELKKIN